MSNNSTLKYLQNYFNDQRAKCRNPNHPGYHKVGALGIKFQADWEEDKEKFCRDIITKLGNQPENHQLSRIDDTKDFEINNLYWRSKEEGNKGAKLVEINGESRTYGDWEKLYNLPDGIIRQRIKQGHTGEALLRSAGRTLYSPGDTVEVPGKGVLIYIRDTDERNPSTGNMIGVWMCYCEERIIFKTQNARVKNGSCGSCGHLHDEWRASVLKNPDEMYLDTLHMFIKAKCYNPNHPEYKLYGAKGIVMQEDWVNDKKKFKSDVLGTIGHRPTKDHQFDRFPNKNGIYEIGNVRWTTAAENCNNKNNNIEIEYNGEKHTIAEWARKTGIKPDTIRGRLLRGWDLKDIFKPVQKREGYLGMENIYYGMMGRCLNENNPKYSNYGDRNISVYGPWVGNMELFISDVIKEIGLRPSEEHELHRPNNDGSYEPGNIKWATSTENNREKTNSYFITIKGEKKTVSEWAEISELNWEVIARRFEVGWGEEDLLLPLQIAWEEEVVKLVRKEYLETDISMNKLSEKYEISRGTMSDIIHGRGHYWDLEDIAKSEKEGAKYDEDGIKSKLESTEKYKKVEKENRSYIKVEVTEDQLSQMIKLKEDGKSYAKIAEETGFAKSSVRTWLTKGKKTVK